MWGLTIAIILFNSIAFVTNRRLTKSQIVHIWTFTICLQGIVDLYLGLKYEAYWYFTNGMEGISIPARTLLIPPVNMMFLNWYPLSAPWFRRFVYVMCWTIFITAYEAATLLPEPWGYFRYGWWNLWYSILSYPLLLLIVLRYYKWIKKIEKEN